MNDHRTRRIGAGILRREEGASAVEFALIAPLLFMLVFGIIYFGIAFLRMQTLRSSVREGGRAAAVGAPTIGSDPGEGAGRLDRIHPRRRRRRREQAVRR